MGIVSRRKGEKVQFNGSLMKVIAPNGFDSMFLQSKDGEIFDVPIRDLEAEITGTRQPHINVDTLRAAKVPAYLVAFKQLLDRDRRTKKEVADAGSKVGISTTAAYEVLRRYDLSGLAAELPPMSHPGGKGKSRIDKAAEKIIQNAIEEILLSRRNHQPSVFYKKAKGRLEAAGYNISHTTLRNRFANIPDYKWNKARKGYTETKRTHAPLMDTNELAKRPLEHIQIDHWRGDIEILSDDRSTIIGRPWVTLGIDIYTRMIYGMHVGLDAPSTTTLGLMMINGMTRKDAMLKQYDLEMDYPISGKPEKIVADNAGEFTGNAMREACQHFGIGLKWRPIGSPQYGGHIERFNGTLARRFPALPGATGSTHLERKAFRPEMTAAFTLEDLTKHILLMINEYHNEVHLGIYMTPLEKFKDYYMGPEGLKRRLPDVYIDNLDLRRQWYPLTTRSFQRYGIMIDHLSYYCEDLQPLVRDRKKYGKVQIRRDPFDVRVIYLLHPTRHEWITVPINKLGFPIASIKELKAARKEALERKRQPTPENLQKIIDAQQKHIEEAQKKTKSAQREASNKSHHNRMRAGQAETVNVRNAEPVLSISPSFGAKTMATTPATKPTPQPIYAQSSEDISSILAGISEEDIEASFND